MSSKLCMSCLYLVITVIQVNLGYQQPIRTISQPISLFVHHKPPKSSTLRHCPASQGYCCEIIDPHRKFVFMLSRHPLLPNQVLPAYSSLVKPYRHQIDPTTAIDESTMEQLPFLSTLSLHPSTPKQYTPGNSETTPNAYQVISALHSLPNQEKNKQKCMGK